MDTQLLKLFVTTARLGSFASAARFLEMDPSSVSRSVASLEQTIGVRLFQRSTRRLVLTEAGELFLSRISPLLEEFDYALDEVRKISSGPTGTLRITSSVAFGHTCLLPHITEFKERYPDIKLDFVLSDSILDLVADGIDLACRLTKSDHLDVISTRLLNSRYHVCVSPEYFNKMSPVHSPHDLEQHNCIVFNLPDYRSRWIFRDADKKLHEVPIKSSLSITNALALRECALSGMGPVLLADWLVKKDISEGKLITLLDQYEVSAENFDTAIWLLYPSRKFLPLKTRVMVDFLKEKFQSE